jgi:hypothetical protein
MSMKDKTQIGLAGEYYVLAQLSQRGFVSALTMGHTKGIDILVSDSDYNTLYRIEVKTTSKAIHRESLFGDTAFYSWTMSEKHESIADDRLYYCFVHLGAETELPKFFLVPSLIVARYVKWQHQYWLSSRKNKVRNTAMRRFRIPVNDPDGYLMNWDALKPTTGRKEQTSSAARRVTGIAKSKNK